MFAARIHDPNMKPVIVISLITAVCLFGDSMLYVALPIHWKEAGLASLIEVGILLSVNRFIRLPLNPLISWIYGKMSIRYGLVLAILLAGMTTLSYGFAQGFWLWLVMRCLWGAAWSFLRLGGYFLILDVSTGQNRGHYMGMYNGLFRLGSLVGMLAGGIFVDLFGLKPVAAVFGVLAFVALPAALFLIPAAKRDEAPEAEAGAKKRADKRQFFTEPAFIWTIVTVFFAMLCLEGMFTATLSHVIDVRLGSGQELFGLALGAASLAGLLQAARWGAGPFLSPWVGKRTDGKWGRKPYLIALLLLAALLMACVQIRMPFWIWTLNLFAILLVATMLTTVMDALASDLSSAAGKAAVMTWFVIAADVGASFGPFLGYLSERIFGLDVTFWMSALLLFLLGAGWLFASAKRNEKIRPDHAAGA